jgi:hypothetical protein
MKGGMKGAPQAVRDGAHRRAPARARALARG